MTPWEIIEICINCYLQLRESWYCIKSITQKACFPQSPFIPKYKTKWKNIMYWKNIKNVKLLQPWFKLVWSKIYTIV